VFWRCWYDGAGLRKSIAAITVCSSKLMQRKDKTSGEDIPGAANADWQICKSFMQGGGYVDIVGWMQWSKALFSLQRQSSDWSPVFMKLFVVCFQE